MKNRKINSHCSSNSNILSPLKKNLKIIEECPETDDIIKKIENLNFSSDGKSFETPFISKTKKKKNSNCNKDISIPNLINYKIVDDFPIDLQSIKDEEFSDYDYISNSLMFKDIKEEKNQNDIFEVLLKEKINRICMLIQKYNINQKCYYKMNNLINDMNIQNINNYRRYDCVLEVILELLSKIKEEYEIKEGLINKLNNFSLNKEDYEKKILGIKKELIDKEREIETLIGEKNSTNKIKVTPSQNLLLEMKNIKKENQYLFDKILSYKIQIKKICLEYKNLHEKYKMSLNGKNEIKEKEKNIFLKKEETISFSLNFSPKKIFNNSLNKANDFGNNSMTKKLVNELISLLSDINKMMFKYDFALVKMNKTNNLKTPLNDIKDLTSNLDIIYLLNENNYKIFTKYIRCNMDIIYNKIINSNKGFIFKNNNNTSQKEFKRTSGEKKKMNGKMISLNNSRVNQTINLYVPENNGYPKNLKYYMSIRKKFEKDKKNNMTRNSTSRNGLTFLNFYSDADLEGNSIIKKSNNKIQKKFSHTINIEKTKKSYNNQNGAKIS